MENNTVIEGTVVPNSQLSLAGVLRIPAVRQVLLLTGVAAAIAIGFAVVLWSRTPSFTQLYGDMSPAEAADITDALRANNIEFKLNAATGSILVPEASLHNARMQLASQGLPMSAAAGMSMLGEQSSFGVSQFMENARYQHALEAELGRTIGSMGVVREARVHLAIPKQSAFIRDQKSTSASVMLHLATGQTLQADQASAIVHLVASSVPNLMAPNVTLIDQFGRMLSSGNEQAVEAQATSQFRYARRLEDTYKARIETLLTPIVGPGRIRAQVDADVDFTVIEETRESFDPANTVVRSEQINEQNVADNSQVAGGIPGALSNQPPQAAESNTADAAAISESAELLNTSRSSVRNFEVDRTISRTRPQTGALRKLSVAVLVDDSPLDPESETPALNAEDLQRYEALVKEAVGFNEARGDTVVVMNAAFRPAGPVEELEPPAIWEKPIVMDIARNASGAIIALALLFGVIRPMLRSVMAGGGAGPGPEFVGAGGAAGGTVNLGGAATQQLAGGGASLPPPKYEEKVAAAKNITGHDPARVAQVVKQWVTENE